MLQMLHSLTSLDGQKKQVEARSVSELLADSVDMLSTPQQSQHSEQQNSQNRHNSHSQNTQMRYQLSTPTPGINRQHNDEVRVLQYTTVGYALLQYLFLILMFDCEAYQEVLIVCESVRLSQH